ncbi:MAG: hypothetical protein IJ017_08280 [Oscillospiraceae bacterium]|nr:hypothetical protein [Oscillospiraceae bacterium]
MKLTCDICGSGLQMNADNQGAACTNCGMAYSIESLRTKLGSSTIDNDTAPESAVRELIITRNFSIVGAPYAIKIMVDETEAAVFNTKGTLSIAIPEGDHEIYAIAQHGANNKVFAVTDKNRLHVTGKNWSGTVSLRRGAFKVYLELSLTENNS